MTILRKVLFAAGFLAAFSPALLRAQIGIEISLNRDVYMLYEPVYACVTLRNDTGRPLLFGKNPKFQGFVLFEIKDRSGRVIPQRPDAGVSVTGLVLRPGEVKRMVIPIHKYYDLDRADRYTINAFVSHNLLPHEYQSRNINFNIEKGVKIWSRTVGMADIEGVVEAKTPRTRTYTIRMLTEAPNKYYYLVVEDEKQTYGVMRVGREIGREKFMAEVDMLSRIHLLVPISPKVFHYLSFSIDGENVNNSYWKISETIPMLYRDPVSGVVTRIGGSEARKGIDFRDPERDRKTVAQMMSADELREAENAPPPKPVRNPGKIELGRELETDGESDKK